MICVVIDVADDGAVRVGVVPPELIERYADSMQPAKSIEDALGTAANLLAGPGAEQAAAAEAGTPPSGAMPMQQTPEQSEASFTKGFAKGPKPY